MSALYLAVREDGGVVARVHTNSYAACFGAGLEIDEFPELGNGLFVRKPGNPDRRHPRRDITDDCHRRNAAPALS